MQTINYDLLCNHCKARASATDQTINYMLKINCPECGIGKYKINGDPVIDRED